MFVDDYDSIIQVFKMFDKNQDGTVLAADLRHILSHLGEVIPEDEIDGLFHSLGYSDVIKYEDFAKKLLDREFLVCWEQDMAYRKGMGGSSNSSAG